MKNTALLFICILFLFSCKEDIPIAFSEANIESSEEAEISINYPNAISTSEASKLINKTLENYIANQLDLSNDSIKITNVKEAAEQFDKAFVDFKTDFPEASQKWEAFIDSEVTYRSPDLICIVVNSYLDTGGAHGNTLVKFLNFNAETGALLTNLDLISNIEGFSKLVESKLNKALDTSSDGDSMEDVFFGENFQLPETIGYSDEGLIILYNPYEIASYAQGIIEFNIPFEEVTSYLLKY
ncbi:protein of unknown function [Formosa sp. Hel1_31_208]|uniref:DUF3298 and DUF4163 domain-containing protein n=1 Tax=Formosa sp. Hel1_31_208 TaxID=1798225 RepID=UPI00087DCD0A|nr:DUF3298 and DUF4163 domain-containing protein [Formosa sp. Hel1_31_208]SDR79497.1 protein of unknown function [Formosa sp. Hel1_31_208]